MKTKNKKSKSAVSPAKNKEKAYLDSIDLQDWWEQFAHKHKKNGTLEYPTIWNFIKSKTKQEWQRKFLYWMLGPKATEGDSKYSSFPQYDWEEKRTRGFWYSSENIENTKAEIRRRETSFARLQTAGDSLLSDLADLDQIRQQINREFGGQLFLSDNTAEENAARVALFMSLKEKVQTMKAHILQTYAKTQGMDLNQLTNFLEVMASGIGKAASAQLGYGGLKQIEEDNKEESGYKKILGQLVDMTMHKAADLELQLPKDAEQVIEDIVIPSKKARVQ